MTILATTAALKYCAIATAACLLMLPLVGKLNHWAPAHSALELVSYVYGRALLVGAAIGLAALPLLAIANLLRVWGVL